MYFYGIQELSSFYTLILSFNKIYTVFDETSSAKSCKCYKKTLNKITFGIVYLEPKIDIYGNRLYFEMETQKKLQANFEQLDVAIRCVVVPEMEVPENPPRSNRRKRKSVPSLRKFCKISNSSENLHFARGLFGRKTILLTGSLSELTIQALFDASQFDPDRKEKEEKEEEAAAAAEEEEKEQEIPEKNLKESSTVEQFGTRLSKVLNKIYTVRGIFQPTSDDVTDQTSATRLHLMIKSGLDILWLHFLMKFLAT